MEIGHLFQCRVHPNHYSRTRGKCIECMAEWERREKEEREKDRARMIEKKARDTGNAKLAKVRYSEGPEIVTKPWNTRRTGDPKFKFAQKLRKWPAKQQKETSGPQLDSEAEQIPCEGQAHVKDKGTTFGLGLFKAKKKWRDGKGTSAQAPRW